MPDGRTNMRLSGAYLPPTENLCPDEHENTIILIIHPVICRNINRLLTGKTYAG